MNAARRKRIAEAMEEIAAAIAVLEECQAEEEDYFEAMPESFQNGEKGEAAQSAIDALSELTAVDLDAVREACGL